MDAGRGREGDGMGGDRGQGGLQQVQGRPSDSALRGAGNAGSDRQQMNRGGASRQSMGHYSGGGGARAGGGGARMGGGGGGGGRGRR
jgi:hypothetical protein